MQVLPLLLLGTGGAYVYKKQKDKARKRSGADCPPENTVTLSESVSAGQQAAVKYANSADPFQEADYYIRTLLPETCNKKSVKSRVKLNFAHAGKDYNIDLSVADLYMFGVISGIDRRVAAGKLNQEQGEKFLTKALEWYKGATGKPFDPIASGLGEIVEVMLQAMKDSIEQALKQLPGPGPKPGGQCPDRVVVDLSDAQRQQIAHQIRTMADLGERNPFMIATRIFADVMPKGCTRSDYKTIVELRHGGALFKTYNAASFFAGLTLDIMEELVILEVMSEQAANQAFNDLRANYKKLTGEELPPNLN